MGKKEKNILGRRLLHSYLSSIISISLVLLLVGIFGMLAINVKQFSNYFKENIKVSVMLKEEITETEAFDLKKKIALLPQVKTIDYISKEQGTKEMQILLGEDFLNVFANNPIPISLDITLNPNFFKSSDVEKLNKSLLAMEQVQEVNYKASLIDLINKNMEKIGITFMVFVVLLLFVSFVLINNTVRLNVYSKRFSIYTMRLVGATRSFIRAPFLLRAVFQGLLAGLLAVVSLLGVLLVVRNEFSQIFMIFDINALVIVLFGVIMLGVLICVVCTYFVVNRLVGLTNDELYY